LHLKLAREGLHLEVVVAALKVCGVQSFL
jgi:hypothetical protein